MHKKQWAITDFCSASPGCIVIALDNLTGLACSRTASEQKVGQMTRKMWLVPLESSRIKFKDNVLTRIQEMLASSVSNAFLQRILDLDEGIRFAGIVDRKAGKLAAAEVRKGLSRLLSDRELEVYVIQSLIRMDSRRTLENKLGRAIYSSTLYENVKRASIPIGDGRNILILSFETRADHDRIICEKIMPMLGWAGSKTQLYSGKRLQH